MSEEIVIRIPVDLIRVILFSFVAVYGGEFIARLIWREVKSIGRRFA